MPLYDRLSTKIYLMEKHLKENGGKTESQPWYLSANWRNGALAHLKLGFYKTLLALVRISLILRGRPASNFTVFTRASKDGLYICNYSYCYYKDFHHKTRNKAIATIIAATIILSIIVSLIFPGYPGVKAATYNWSQTNWSGSTDGGTYPNHTLNQSNWTKYSAKDADLTASTTLSLAAIAGSVSETSNADFNAGTQGNTYVSSGTVLLMLPPSIVTGLSLTASSTQMVLNWTAPSNGGSSITSYKVYRGTSPSGESFLSTGGCSGLGAVLTCTDTGLTNGITYYYKVSAVNAIGEGSQSSEASATTLVSCSKTVSGTLSFTAPYAFTITSYTFYGGGGGGTDSGCSNYGGKGASTVMTVNGTTVVTAAGGNGGLSSCSSGISGTPATGSYSLSSGNAVVITAGGGGGGATGNGQGSSNNSTDASGVNGGSGGSVGGCCGGGAAGAGGSGANGSAGAGAPGSGGGGGGGGAGGAANGGGGGIGSGTGGGGGGGGGSATFNYAAASCFL